MAPHAGSLVFPGGAAEAPRLCGSADVGFGRCRPFGECPPSAATFALRHFACPSTFSAMVSSLAAGAVPFR